VKRHPELATKVQAQRQQSVQPCYTGNGISGCLGESAWFKHLKLTNVFL
jgi:hypothetical protein